MVARALALLLMIVAPQLAHAEERAPSVMAMWARRIDSGARIGHKAVTNDAVWRITAQEVVRIDANGERRWRGWRGDAIGLLDSMDPSPSSWIRTRTGFVLVGDRDQPVETEVVPRQHLLAVRTDGPRLWWHEPGRIAVFDADTQQTSYHPYSLPAGTPSLAQVWILQVGQDRIILSANGPTADTGGPWRGGGDWAVIVPRRATADTVEAQAIGVKVIRNLPREGVLLDLDGVHRRWLARDGTSFELECPGLSGDHRYTVYARGGVLYALSGVGASGSSFYRLAPGTCQALGVPSGAKRAMADEAGGLWLQVGDSLWYVDPSGARRFDLPEGPRDWTAADRAVAWVILSSRVLRLDAHGTSISPASIGVSLSLTGLVPGADDLGVTRDGNVAWLVEPGVGITRFAWDGHRIASGGRTPMGTAMGAARDVGPRHVWVGDAERELYLVRELGASPQLSLALGAARFDPRQPTAELTQADASALPKIQIDPLDGVSTTKGRVRINAGLGDTEFGLTENPRRISWNTEDGRAPVGEALDLHLHVEVPKQVSLYATWRGVRVLGREPRWYDPGWVRGVGLGLGTLGLIALLGLFATSVPVVGRWLGIGVGGASVLAGKIGAIGSISWLAFAGVLGGGLFVAGLIGTLSPATLRTLGQSHPTRAITWAVCRLRRTRRKMYAAHVASLRAWTQTSSTATASGTAEPSAATVAIPYVAIPAKIQHGRDTIELEPQPADAIAKVLSARVASRADVIIIGPGGCGKSALLSELLRRALDAFERDPRMPLPVLIEQGDDAPLVDALWARLERHLPSREVFEWARDAGDYLIVVDGMTERGWPASRYAELEQAAATSATRVLATTRPDDAFIAPFRDGAHVLVWPQRLDDATLPSFLAACGVHEPLPEPLLRACRHGDAYLPLLVRLATMSLDAAYDVIDLASLYRIAVRRLVDASDALYAAAARLAHASYWERVQPSFTVDASFADPGEVQSFLRRGLLVHVGADGREVKFAHDSMQVFLAAQQLYTKDDWTVFLRAATDRRFGGAEVVASAGDLPDMLRFAIGVFHPSQRVRATLVSAIEAWAAQDGDRLSRADVLACAPPRVREHLEATTASGLSAGATLAAAVASLRAREGGGDEVALLDDIAVLYCNCARRIVARTAASG